MESKPILKCPLCHGAEVAAAAHVERRTFYSCRECALIFADPKSKLSTSAEKTRYDSHHNVATDPGYCKHLAELIDALPPASERKALLDYGSGPNPVMAEFLRQRGYEVSIFDPFYAPDTSALLGRYDIITSCEVVEHFSTPRDEFQKLRNCLAPSGLLALKTQLYRGKTELKDWWYIKDPTHMVFYSEACATWIQKNLGFSRVEILGNIILLYVD